MINQTVSVTATVAGLPAGALTPTGTLTIFEGVASSGIAANGVGTYCTATLVVVDGKGSGSCDLTFLNSGVKTITALYNPANTADFSTSSDTESHTVTAVNNAPVANAQSVSTAEDTAKAITLTGTDVDGDTLTYSIVADPSNGILSGSAPALTYTPAANYNGQDSFTFKVNDGTLNSAPATVSITVTAVNNAPIITEGASISVSMSASTPFNLILHAADVDGDTITWSNTPAGHGTASASGTGPSKAIIYTPTFNFIGSDSFDVQVSDGNGGTDTIIVNVTITCTSFLPIIVH